MKIENEAEETILRIFKIAAGKGRTVSYTETHDHCIVVAKTNEPRVVAKLVQFNGGSTRIVRHQDGKRTRVTVDINGNIETIPPPENPLQAPEKVTAAIKLRAKYILREVRKAMPPLNPSRPPNLYVKLLPPPARKPE